MNKEYKRGRKVFSKKAVSGVVTTVLLILIVLASIGIVWAVISSFLKQGTQGIEGAADCFSLQLSLESAVNDSTPSTQDNIKLRVKRLAGEGNITAIKFLVDGADTSFTGVIPEVAETRTFSARIVNPEPIGKNIEIAAVVGSRTCGVSDSAVITAA
ncbi:hypothetical protein AUJ62_00480 [Candidatus Pacearchaeota archaeon CG1_02_32_21]|nr:MAG: hypothetical protein AUJ62_00480 [Candidatus Pacearchaeota archaeon CG1_02_32_21]